jgi:PncC family amidohydrolase
MHKSINRTYLTRLSETSAWYTLSVMTIDLLNLSQRVGDHLQSQGWTITTAESCTGGLIGHILTEVAGSSSYYLGGIVAYSNTVKQAYLGVPAAVLEQHGAVSEATARAMAEGVRERLGSDIGIATTGIAGPSGGTPSKPVGLIYVAVATPTATYCQHFMFKGDRSANKRDSAIVALEMILH